MSSKEAYAKMICELLLVWDRLNTTVWPGAKEALEIRINQLIDEGGFQK